MQKSTVNHDTQAKVNEWMLLIYKDMVTDNGYCRSCVSFDIALTGVLNYLVSQSAKQGVPVTFEVIEEALARVGDAIIGTLETEEYTTHRVDDTPFQN